MTFNSKTIVKRLKKTLTPRRFLWLSYGVLGLTTIYWSLLGAVFHQRNADQLVDPRLFTNYDVFTNASFPSQHTFLFKWPLFWLVQLCNGQPWAFYIATVVVALLTVGGVTYILSRLEKRPYILGLLFLALSSVLLLIPIEPAPGSLLPVGMAMLTTRNLEYVMYMLALLWLCNVPAQRLNKRFWLSIGLLGVLFASDKLFVGLSVGGGISLLIFGLAARQVVYRRVALRWLAATFAALIVSIALLLVISQSGISNLQALQSSPYRLSVQVGDKVLAGIYTILGIAVNFGANPISSVVIVRDIPGALLKSFTATSIVSYLVNASILVTAVWSAFALIKLPFQQAKQKFTTDNRVIFSLALIGSTLAAIGQFIATDHYYAVDARYLTIGLFAGFVALAVYGSKRLRSRLYLRLTSVLLFSCIIGCFAAAANFQSSYQATDTAAKQDKEIALALKHHPVKTLVADYWRAYPITTMNQNVNPLPLDNCTLPRQILTSEAWQRDALKKSFAYLLTTKRTNTGYNGCSLAKIRESYGSPSDSFVIDGSIAEPNTLLLYYDTGVNHPKPGSVIKPKAPSLLRTLSELRDSSCKHRTVVQIIAHQDDDALFMNPDLLHGLQAGDCVRSIYLTAGDAGSDEAYWLSREEGTKAAYAQALGINQPRWTGRDVQLSDRNFIKAVRLNDQNRRVSLAFLRLPDGNLTGNGFGAHNHESLRQLMAGTISEIHTVDGRSSYTREELVDALTKIMENYQPSQIRAQAFHNASARYPDHSDHLASGSLAKEAYQRYVGKRPDAGITYYLGYPVRDRAANVEPTDLLSKERMFFDYGKHDSAACITESGCEKTAYEYYLGRQYHYEP